MAGPKRGSICSWLRCLGCFCDHERQSLGGSAGYQILKLGKAISENQKGLALGGMIFRGLGLRPQRFLLGPRPGECDAMPAVLTATTAVVKSMSLAGVAETVSATKGVEIMLSVI